MITVMVAKRYSLNCITLLRLGAFPGIHLFICSLSVWAPGFSLNSVGYDNLRKQPRLWQHTQRPPVVIANTGDYQWARRIQGLTCILILFLSASSLAKPHPS